MLIHTAARIAMVRSVVASAAASVAAAAGPQTAHYVAASATALAAASVAATAQESIHPPCKKGGQERQEFGNYTPASSTKATPDRGKPKIVH